MRNDVSKTKIEANPNILRIPIYVIRSGKRGLTITCADSKHGFKVGTSRSNLKGSGQRSKTSSSNWSKSAHPHYDPATGFWGDNYILPAARTGHGCHQMSLSPL